MTDKEILDWIDNVGVAELNILVRNVENSCQMAGENGPFPIRYIFQVAIFYGWVYGRGRTSI